MTSIRPVPRHTTPARTAGSWRVGASADSGICRVGSFTTPRAALREHRCVFSVYQISRKGGREKKRRSHGLLLHAGCRVVRTRRRHGWPPRKARSPRSSPCRPCRRPSSAIAGPRSPEPLRFLQDAALAGHQQLLRYATQRALIDTPPHHPGRLPDAGQTPPTGHIAAISRLYLVRGDKLIARTRDHSYTELQQTMSQVVPLPRPAQPQCVVHLPGQPRQTGRRHRRPAAAQSRRPPDALLRRLVGHRRRHFHHRAPGARPDLRFGA